MRGVSQSLKIFSGIFSKIGMNLNEQVTLGVFKKFFLEFFLRLG